MTQFFRLRASGKLFSIYRICGTVDSCVLTGLICVTPEFSICVTNPIYRDGLFVAYSLCCSGTLKPFRSLV